MAYYVYECPKCEQLTEAQFPIGEAPDQLECSCKEQMRRSWKNLNVAGRVQGGTNGGTKIGR